MHWTKHWTNISKNHEYKLNLFANFWTEISENIYVSDLDLRHYFMTAVTLRCGNDKDAIWLLRTTEQCSFTLQNDLNS